MKVVYHIIITSIAIYFAVILFMLGQEKNPSTGLEFIVGLSFWIVCFILLIVCANMILYLALKKDELIL